MRWHSPVKDPKRQVWRNDQLSWSEVDNCDTSAQALFGHLRRVRNNLFHGGKFHGIWIDPDRSTMLMQHSLTLLDALSDDDPALKEALRDNHWHTTQRRSR